jgi:hypothetical protein
MIMFRNLFVVALGLLVSVGDVLSQEPAGPDSALLPGGTYRGRYIGFKPRHGQVPPPTPRRSAGSRSAVGPGGARAAASEVRPSVFDDADALQDETSRDEAEPIILPVPEGDSLVDAGGEWLTAPACRAEPVMWARGDYLLWWTKGVRMPPLATRSVDGTLQDDAGVLGPFGTSVLFGGGDMLDESRSGGRIVLGAWLDPCHQTGLELSYLGLGREDAGFRGSDEEFSILARPFRDAVSGQQDSRLIVFPGLVEGAIAIDAWTEFQTAEALFRRPGRVNGWSNVDFFFGYRYAELEDGVAILESTVSLAAPTTGTEFQLDDRFETRNQFHGGQVGARFLGHTAPGWQLELLGKFAVGNTRSQTTLAGQTVVTAPTGGSSTHPAGLLVQATNRGVFDTDEVSTITEFGVTLHRQLSYGWSCNVGYSFLLWTDVLRAGEQIDTTINVSQIPPGTLSGEPRPAFPDRTSDFWAQGLNLGLEFRY